MKWGHYRCPFIRICEEEVDWEYFEDICLKRCYLCQRYRELAKEKKKPREHLKILL